MRRTIQRGSPGRYPILQSLPPLRRDSVLHHLDPLHAASQRLRKRGKVVRKRIGGRDDRFVVHQRRFVSAVSRPSVRRWRGAVSRCARSTCASAEAK